MFNGTQIASETKTQLQLKICGMRNEQNIKDVLQLNPDYMGFIFYEKSARYVADRLDPIFLTEFQSTTKKVGVFVNASATYVQETHRKYEFDLIQLHGTETASYCKELSAAGLKLIKAFSVDDHFDFHILAGYEPYCDYFLFDTKGTQHGGNGIKFNWDILQTQMLHKPFFISGGIATADLEQVFALQNKLPLLVAIDVNSKFEDAPALKNIDQLTLLKQKLNDYNHS